jgi:hypothetical protein
MSATTKTIINIAISVIALLVFVILYGVELADAWKQVLAPDDPTRVKLATFAVGAAGLVAAVVATALALPVPPPPGVMETPLQLKRRQKSVGGFVKRLGDSIAGTFDDKKWKELLATVYVIAYLLISAVSIFTWIFQDASDLIKAQALTSFGLLTAAAKSYLTE